MAKSTSGGARQPLAQSRPSKAASPKVATPQRPAIVPRVGSGSIAKRGASKLPAAGPKKTMVPPRLPRSTKRGAKLTSPTPAYAATIYDILQRTYPDAHCELDFTNAFQLLGATILSAQCTDKRVNLVTPTLFAKYPDAAALSGAQPDDVEEIIRTTGFFRAKTKSLIGMASALVERHGGTVPRTMEELVELPGVGRKTANVILGNAYGINEGITVDTHVQRLSGRLGLTTETDPVKVEQALMPLFPREHWTMVSHLLIFHGRRICEARKPRCGECPLVTLCPSADP